MYWIINRYVLDDQYMCTEFLCLYFIHAIQIFTDFLFSIIKKFCETIISEK